mmetsp:Transcript_1350/g.2648  ORF Transcript_1350/g.2648 Transcript_1350/m.2648 type:complete len:231 (+) Transcript_1350:144-836(+)
MRPFRHTKRGIILRCTSQFRLIRIILRFFQLTRTLFFILILFNLECRIRKCRIQIFNFLRQLGNITLLLFHHLRMLLRRRLLLRVIARQIIRHCLRQGDNLALQRLNLALRCLLQFLLLLLLQISHILLQFFNLFQARLLLQNHRLFLLAKRRMLLFELRKSILMRFDLRLQRLNLIFIRRILLRRVSVGHILPLEHLVIRVIAKRVLFQRVHLAHNLIDMNAFHANIAR